LAHDFEVFSGLAHLTRLPLRSLNLSHLEQVTDRAVTPLLSQLLFPSSQSPRKTMHRNQSDDDHFVAHNTLNINGCLSLTDNLLRSVFDLLESSATSTTSFRLIQMMHCPNIHADVIADLRQLLPNCIVAF
jgi:hypothetical protein